MGSNGIARFWPRAETAIAAALVACFTCISAGSAQAAVLGPMYPPPGGVTFNSTGSIGTTGATRTYSAFAPSELATIYFGKSRAVPVQLSMDGATFPGAEITAVRARLKPMAPDVTVAPDENDDEDKDDE